MDEKSITRLPNETDEELNARVSALLGAPADMPVRVVRVPPEAITRDDKGNIVVRLPGLSVRGDANT